MSILKIETISNIEAVLPLYEVNNNNSSLKSIMIDKINSISEINLNSLENSNELINNLIEDEEFDDYIGDIGINFIEGHHIYPISELKAETKIKSTDILMVCSNCHRMIHRAYPCLTKERLIEIIKGNMQQ